MDWRAPLPAPLASMARPSWRTCWCLAGEPRTCPCPRRACRPARSLRHHAGQELRTRTGQNADIIPVPAPRSRCQQSASPRCEKNRPLEADSLLSRSFEIGRTWACSNHPRGSLAQAAAPRRGCCWACWVFWCRAQRPCGHMWARGAPPSSSSHVVAPPHTLLRGRPRRQRRHCVASGPAAAHDRTNDRPRCVLFCSVHLAVLPFQQLL